ncbi:MAG: DMT family transporter [Actinobacteria bacterium]|nr:DMT family transporter [Actinomycetota bacterium]
MDTVPDPPTSARDQGLHASRAGFALALGNMAYFAEAKEGDIGVVSVLGALSPLVTALLAVVFLRERLVRLEVVALGVVFLGTVLVVL